MKKKISHNKNGCKRELLLLVKSFLSLFFMLALVTEGCSIRRRDETDNAINIFVSDKTIVLGIRVVRLKCTETNYTLFSETLFHDMTLYHLCMKAFTFLEKVYLLY